MKLTNENYFSKEANQKYMSSTMYKNFAGMFGRPACEAHSLAVLKGDWSDVVTTPMLVGSYVDAHFSETLDVFKAQHKEIFTKKGDLKSEYKQAEVCISRIERSPFFMYSLSGEKQPILTAEMFGCEWKCAIDSLKEGKFICDLKTSRNFRKLYHVKDYGLLNFIEYWGYDIQLAIYQKIVEINTGKRLPVFISVVSKDPYPDIEVIDINNLKLDECLIEV